MYQKDKKYTYKKVKKYFKLMNDIFTTGRVFYSDNTVGDYIAGFRAAARNIKI